MTIEDLKNEEIKANFGMPFVLGLIVMIWYPLYGAIIASLCIIGATAIMLLYIYLLSQ